MIGGEKEREEGGQREREKMCGETEREREHKGEFGGKMNVNG